MPKISFTSVLDDLGVEEGRMDSPICESNASSSLPSVS
jgi:hypothetical protein